MFRKYQTTASIYRKQETTDGKYKKFAFIDTWRTALWHLKAQSIERSIDNGGFGKVYKFTTDKTDINEGDRLIIDGVNYDVKWVSDFWWLTFEATQVLLNRL